MEPIAVPMLTVSFAIDLEVEYNSFGGKTADEIADALQDELDSILFEISPAVKGVFTSMTSLSFND